MNDLRLVLVIGGVLVLALIWLLDARRERIARRQRTILRRGASPAPEPRFDTRAGVEAEDVAEPGDDVPMPPISPRGDGPGPAPGPKFVAIHVQAPAETHFRQQSIFSAAGAAGLEFDERGIFVMPGAGSALAPLFTVANLHEPGTFSRDTDARPSRGLILILPLPVADEPGMVLELMLHTAELLAGQLGGTLLDGARRPLDTQGIEALRRTVGAQVAR